MFQYKHNVLRKEYIMQALAYNICVNPLYRKLIYVQKPYEYDESSQTMRLQPICGKTIKEMYGEKWENVPPEIQTKVKNVVTILWDNNIVYPSILPDAFVLYKDEVWPTNFANSFIASSFPKKHEW